MEMLLKRLRSLLAGADRHGCLDAEGWTVLSQKPLQIKNNQGVTLEDEEAKHIIDDIVWDYEN